MKQIKFLNPSLAKQLSDNCYFITSENMLNEIVQTDRLAMVLVRCGNGRFIAPAQNVKHFTDMVAKSNDYVRDMSMYNPE